MKVNIIAISGIMASGKTTLAKNIARKLGWTYLLESPLTLSFIKDLFANQQRWAFDAQLAFLTEKSLNISRLFSAGNALILDRSVQEGVQIFAEYFFRGVYRSKK